MREYFHYYCTLGCSWLPLVSFLKAGVHRPVVPLGSDVPGEGHPCIPEGPQYNPKAIPFFSSSCFSASTLRFGVKSFSNAICGLIRCSPGKVIQCPRRQSFVQFTFTVGKLSTLYESVV